MTRNGLLTGLIGGAAVGAVAGLMLAPRPGKETRNMVMTRAGEMRQKAGGYMGTLRRRVRRGSGIEAVAEPSYEQDYTG